MTLQRNLIVGFPKSGKTGSLACLLDAGYTLRYLDFDRNTQPLTAFARSTDNLQIVRCEDALKIIDRTGEIKYDGPPKSISTAMAALNQWPFDQSAAFSWGPRDILVVDSGSVMAENALRRSLFLNGREGKKPQFGDYTAAHDTITNLCVAAKSLPCHFIMITHLFLMGPDLSAGDIENDALAERVIEKKLEGADNVPWKLAPKTVGRALHDMAKHFSGVIHCRTAGTQRKLYLVPIDGVDAGVPVAGLPQSLDIKDGMAKIFEAANGTDP